MRLTSDHMKGGRLEGSLDLWLSMLDVFVIILLAMLSVMLSASDIEQVSPFGSLANWSSGSECNGAVLWEMDCAGSLKGLR